MPQDYAGERSAQDAGMAHGGPDRFALPLSERQSLLVCCGEIWYTVTSAMHGSGNSRCSIFPKRRNDGYMGSFFVDELAPNFVAAVGVLLLAGFVLLSVRSSVAAFQLGSAPLLLGREDGSLTDYQIFVRSLLWAVGVKLLLLIAAQVLFGQLGGGYGRAHRMWIITSALRNTATNPREKRRCLSCFFRYIRICWVQWASSPGNISGREAPFLCCF